MADLKTIPLAKIHVPERLRAVEEDQALAISTSIVEHGLINPITVRATPRKSATPYTLVSGAHRLRAIELLEDAEIDCVVVEGDADEARLIEITENLFRNDLSVMDRTIFVASYRETWERKHGKIQRGGDQMAKRQVVALLADEAEAGFSVHVADRLGVSRRSIERLNVIAQNLHPGLRSILRGTPVADNQSQLIALAKMAPQRQQQVAQLVSEGHELDVALTATDPHAAAAERRTMGEKRRQTVLTNFRALGPNERRSALSELVKSHAGDFVPVVCETLPEDHQRAVYATLKAKFGGAA